MKDKKTDREEQPAAETKKEKCFYFPDARNGMTIWAENLAEAEEKLKEALEPQVINEINNK